MTPEAIRKIGKVRQEFHTEFAAIIDVPVNITKGDSYSSNFPKLSWVDLNQRLNYVYVYAHIAPDQLLPDRPLILRIGVNKGLGWEAVKRSQGSKGKGDKVLRFDLTLLPDEILDFIPWLVGLLKSDDSDTRKVINPPFPLNCSTLCELLRNGAWTQNAKLCLAENPVL